jgi:hypothetical protein
MGRLAIEPAAPGMDGSARPHPTAGVEACVAAEKSAATGKVVKLAR